MALLHDLKNDERIFRVVIKYGSLFSGAGLGDFGFELAGFDCRWQVENNEYCQKILNLRWPNVKKYKDIKGIKAEELEKVDLVVGGFPCQPFSVAGKRDGEDDDRNLWPEMFRIIKAVKPRWVVAENVPGLISLYLDNILSDLESADYICWPVVFSSHSLGAWHKRERLWIVAHARHQCRRNIRTVKKRPDSSAKRSTNNCSISRSNSESENVANTTDTRIEGMCRRKEPADKALAYTKSTKSQGPRSTRSGRDGSTNNNIFRRFWSTEPNVGRVVNGCAKRVDRLKALGNGQTPCSTFLIGEIIKELSEL